MSIVYVTTQFRVRSRLESRKKRVNFTVEFKIIIGTCEWDGITEQQQSGNCSVGREK